MYKTKCKFEIKKQTYLDPERLSDNDTLDTFLHRIRLEIGNKHKQNRQPHKKVKGSPQWIKSTQY